MRQSGSPAPGTPGGPRSRIKPTQGADFDGENLAADERLDRLLGDADLLLNLQLSEYADWATVSAEFARYGLNVMMGWIRAGAIFVHVFEKTGHQLQRPEERLDDEAVSDLATDTVVAALHAFLEKVLKKNLWDPNRGASLKTFFIGQCIFQFRNVYRSWYRARRSLAGIRLEGDNAKLDAAGSVGDPESELIRQAEAAAALELLSTDKARLAVALYAMGYSYTEIAVELGVADDKAVENLVGHQRRRLLKQSIPGEQAV